MYTFVFKQVWGTFRPKDREYRFQSGEYVRRPDGEVFLVLIDEDIELIPIEIKNIPEKATIVDLVVG